MNDTLIGERFEELWEKQFCALAQHRILGEPVMRLESVRADLKAMCREWFKAGMMVHEEYPNGYCLWLEQEEERVKR